MSYVIICVLRLATCKIVYLFIHPYLLFIPWPLLVLLLVLNFKDDHVQLIAMGTCRNPCYLIIYALLCYRLLLP